MPISPSDVLFKYSTKLGTAGNSQIQSDPNSSLGKYISTTLWSGSTLHDLFDVISGSENNSSNVDYRCIFIHNNHGTLTYQSVVVWISALTVGGANIQIGIDPTGPTGISSTSAQAVQITNDVTAPAGVTFSAPTTQGAGLLIGDILSGQCQAIWIQRTATNSAALNNDSVTLSFSGDSAA